MPLYSTFVFYRLNSFFLQAHTSSPRSVPLCFKKNKIKKLGQNSPVKLDGAMFLLLFFFLGLGRRSSFAFASTPPRLVRTARACRCYSVYLLTGTKYLLIGTKVLAYCTKGLASSVLPRVLGSSDAPVRSSPKTARAAESVFARLYQ